MGFNKQNNTKKDNRKAIYAFAKVSTNERYPDYTLLTGIVDSNGDEHEKITLKKRDPKWAHVFSEGFVNGGEYKISLSADKKKLWSVLPVNGKEAGIFTGFWRGGDGHPIKPYRDGKGNLCVAANFTLTSPSFDGADCQIRGLQIDSLFADADTGEAVCEQPKFDGLIASIQGYDAPEFTEAMEVLEIIEKKALEMKRPVDIVFQEGWCNFCNEPAEDVDDAWEDVEELSSADEVEVETDDDETESDFFGS